MIQINKDILTSIFHFLEYPEWKSISGVCKSWRKAALTPEIHGKMIRSYLEVMSRKSADQISMKQGQTDWTGIFENSSFKKRIKKISWGHELLIRAGFAELDLYFVKILKLMIESQGSSDWIFKSFQSSTGQTRSPFEIACSIGKLAPLFILNYLKDDNEKDQVILKRNDKGLSPLSLVVKRGNIHCIRSIFLSLSANKRTNSLKEEYPGKKTLLHFGAQSQNKKEVIEILLQLVPEAERESSMNQKDAAGYSPKQYLE